MPWLVCAFIGNQLKASLEPERWAKKEGERGRRRGGGGHVTYLSLQI